MPIVTETKTFYLTGYNADISTIASASNINNFIGKPSSNRSYGQFGLVTGANAYTYAFVTFDLSSIPEGATIESVNSSKIKVARSVASTSYVKNNYVKGYRLHPDTGALNTVGTSVSFTNTAAVLDLEWTTANIQRVLTEGDNLLIRLQGQRGSSNTTTNYYMRVYGAELTVTYSYEAPPENILYVKNNNSWQMVSKAYKKTNGIWVEETDLTQVFNNNNTYIKGIS